jgi:myo-inositol 2-dehydrogenase / D-chiro-inositol 1-dehydrogenase
LAYSSIIESSGHHGLKFYEYAALIDELKGEDVHSAIAQQGLWAIVAASAAQAPMLSGAAMNTHRFLIEHDLVATLEE